MKTPTKQEPHVHNFKKLGYIREVGTTNPSELLRVDIPARTIDRIILTRACTCGASQAFDCGNPSEMRVLLEKFKG